MVTLQKLGLLTLTADRDSMEIPERLGVVIALEEQAAACTTLVAAPISRKAIERLLERQAMILIQDIEENCFVQTEIMPQMLGDVDRLPP